MINHPIYRALGVGLNTPEQRCGPSRRLSAAPGSKNSRGHFVLYSPKSFCRRPIKAVIGGMPEVPAPARLTAFVPWRRRFLRVASAPLQLKRDQQRSLNVRQNMRLKEQNSLTDLKLSGGIWSRFALRLVRFCSPSCRKR